MGLFNTETGAKIARVDKLKICSCVINNLIAFEAVKIDK
jgi:hypothetical protein